MASKMGRYAAPTRVRWLAGVHVHQGVRTAAKRGMRCARGPVFAFKDTKELTDRGDGCVYGATRGRRSCRLAPLGPARKALR